MKILMVCLGNICRSPLAEGILLHKLSSYQLDWEIDSAGTGGWHSGEQADIRSIRMAKKYGIDLTYQRARKINQDDLGYFDLILAMDRSNLKDIVLLTTSKELKNKVKLITEYSEKYKDQDVPDPYYDKDDGFQIVYNILDDATNGIIKKLS